MWVFDKGYYLITVNVRDDFEFSTKEDELFDSNLFFCVKIYIIKLVMYFEKSNFNRW